MSKSIFVLTLDNNRVSFIPALSSCCVEHHAGGQLRTKEFVSLAEARERYRELMQAGWHR